MVSATQPECDIERIQLLQGMSAFGGVDEEVVRYVLDRAEIIQVKRDEYLYRQDDPGDSCFVVEKGQFALYHRYEGEDRHVRTFSRGDCFGEAAMIALTPRICSARALTDSSVIQISADLLHQIYDHDAKQYIVMLLNIARRICRTAQKDYDTLAKAKFDSDGPLD